MNHWCMKTFGKDDKDFQWGLSYAKKYRDLQELSAEYARYPTVTLE